MPKPLLTSLILLTILLQACRVAAPQFTGTAFNNASSLEGTGFTQERLDSLSSFLTNNLPTTGMMILHDGKVIYEYGNTAEVSYIASCRKSVLSMLYGKYVEDGIIDLSETIGSIGVEEDQGLLPNEKAATVDHIITSRSGVFLEPANKGYDEANILARGSVKPGEYFVYNNWDFNVAGYILEAKTGNSVYQELEEQLAIPLGFQDWNIENQKKKYSKKKSRYPAYHIYISTRDMAKIGQLMLNNGQWEGKQLVSEDWINNITTTVTPTEVLNERYSRDSNSPYQFSYGYMWWLVDNFKHHPDFEGAYSASGFGGQFITVIPKRDLVVVHKVKLPTLVRWGLKPGGISDYTYWKLLHDFIGS